MIIEKKNNKGTIMKHIIQLISASILFALSSSTLLAEAGFVKGTIKNIRVHDAQAHPVWAPPIFWFSLNTQNTSGSCTKWYGDTLFVASHDSFLSIILSKQAQGEEVAIHYDDQVTRNGFCVAQYITTGNPPPLY